MREEKEARKGEENEKEKKERKRRRKRKTEIGREMHRYSERSAYAHTCILVPPFTGRYKSASFISAPKWMPGNKSSAA